MAYWMLCGPRANPVLDFQNNAQETKAERPRTYPRRKIAQQFNMSKPISGLLAVLSLLIPIYDAVAADFAAGWRAYNQGDYQSARSHWEPLAKDGDPRAQYNLGVMYERGHGVSANPERAFELWTKAASQDMLWAQHNLGLALISGTAQDPDYQAGLAWLTKSSDAGFAPSHFALGQLYARGLGVEPNPQKAVSLYSLAADKGIAEAQYELGRAYRDGIGTEPDLMLSTTWLGRAAAQGNAAAQNSLGGQYARGKGVERDDMEALKWLTLSARQNYPQAAENADRLKNRMSEDQILESERRADAWLTDNTRFSTP